ncbi:DUF11 domain-containing protein [Streptomyces albus]|uniref:DUF11 domain-containing protein n=1 Tax=Streptomyces albus TaxID=1888 RepID=UPI0004C9C865|nr:DUF11 domain-containing protein [Streptomyces albus]
MSSGDVDPEGERYRGTGWRHPLVLAGLVSGICGIPVAAILSATALADVYDRYFGDAATKVTYTLKYTNTGKAHQKAVDLAVTLPDGVEYVLGSTAYSDASTKDKWVRLDKTDIVPRGLRLHENAPGSSTFVKFEARVSDHRKQVCGPDGVGISVTARGDDEAAKAASTLQLKTECA